MKKIFIFGVLVLFLISFVVAENNDTNETCTENWDCTNWSTCINNEQTRTCIDLNDCGTTEDKPEESQTCVIEETDQEKCENVGGIWKLFGDGCVDSCELARQDPNNPIACTEAETMGCDCGSDKCWDGETCVLNEEEDEEASNKVCCHKFGYGNQMKKVNSQYQWIDEESCVTPEGFVGGGREVVDDEYCENQTKKIHRIKPSLPIDECPEGCTCTGSTVKCPINDGGRIMTVYAGKSGNVIVQIKNVNMSTNVTLYKANKTLYGVFRNNQTKEIKVFPDEVKEKIRQRIKARLENYNITLDEDGIYQVQAKKKARLFFLIPVREKIKSQINSETGEIIKIRNPWWGFLARDIKEDNQTEDTEEETEEQSSVDEIVENNSQ